MYLPSHFDERRPEHLHALVRRHPLGLLITLADDAGLRADPIPFLLDTGADAGPGAGPDANPDAAAGIGVLRGHVARANPLWRDSRTDIDSLVVFQGPQAYVSPSFYPTKAETGKVVPTWNYCVVQARGRLRAVDDDPAWLLALVNRLTERHEADRPAPWAVADAPAGYIDAMLRAIVGIEITLTALTGKWKVSQNRSAADRDGVAAGLRGDALRSGGNGDAEAGAAAGAMAALVAGGGRP